MTRTDLLNYIETLDEPVRRLFYEADMFVINSADMLSEEFQIAADVVAIFEMRAKHTRVQVS